MKLNNILMETPEGEERKHWTENLFEKMTENFPNLVKKKHTEGHEAQRNKLDPKRSIPRHSIIKTTRLKDKERIFKGARQRR